MSFKEATTRQLELPINGKTYRIPDLPASVGVPLRLLIEDPEADVPQRSWTPTDEHRAFLGDAYDQMMADGVPDGLFKRAFVVSQYAWLVGLDAAEQAWNDESLSPETLALLLLAEVASVKGATAPMSLPTPVTGEGISTPTKDSSSGTSGPKVTRRRSSSPKAPQRSPGGGSRRGGTSSKRTGPASTTDG